MEAFQVPMDWKDFFWALEKLRHSPIPKQTRQTDWFKLNPLEIVLLGCESLQADPADDGVTIGNISGVSIGMKSIQNELSKRIRSWKRLILTLTILIGEESPVSSIQRAVLALQHVYSAAKKIPRICVMVTVRLIESVLPALKALLARESCLGLARAAASGLVVELDRISVRSTYSLSRSSSEALICHLESLGECVNLRVALCSDLGKFESRSTYIHCLEEKWRFHDVVECMESSAVSAALAISCCLDLIYTLSCDELFEGPLALQIVLSLIECCSKWRKAIGSKSVIPEKLAELCISSVVKSENAEQLRVLIDFLASPFDILLGYSTEGYLSQDSSGFMLSLLDLLMTGLESNIELISILTTLLPNLFSQFFGIKSSKVSSQVLELGCLALGSVHSKSILKEGLFFLGKLCRLFPPLDSLIAEKAAVELHAEALSIAEPIVDELVIDALWSIEPESQHCLEMIAKNLVEDAFRAATQKIVDPESVKTFTTEENPQKQDHVADNALRVEVASKLVSLACSMVSRGDDFTFLFGSVLPKLFQARHVRMPSVNTDKLRKFFGADPGLPASSIQWTGDRKKFAIELLTLAKEGVDKRLCSPFLLCGVATPKLMKNIDEVDLIDEEKIQLTIDVLQIARDALEAGHDIERFIMHGIDFLSSLIPKSSTPSKVKQLMCSMAKSFVDPSQASVLVLAKFACDFMLSHFPEDKPSIQRLFQVLIRKGKRNEIRSVFRVCREPFHLDRFACVRPYLYDFATGSFGSKQLQNLSEHLQLLFGLESPKGKVPGRSSGQGEPGEGKVLGVVRSICDAVLRDIVDHLKGNCYFRDKVDAISSRLSRFVLVKTLFEGELTESLFESQPPEAVLVNLEKKFPRDVLADDWMMESLTVCGARLEHIELPRYDFLKSLLVRLLVSFLNFEEDSLPDRLKSMEADLLKLSRNSEDRRRLLRSGYSVLCWKEPAKVTVKTDGQYSIEENLRQSLLLCYNQYVELLKELGIAQVVVDGEQVKVDSLFDETVSLNALKGRRAIVVKEIDHRLGSKPFHSAIARKMTLLAEEDQIEHDFEQQGRAPVKPKTFTAALHTGFFQCSRCCGVKMSGCYAPSGEHCERPLEIGLRQDSAFLSIYDESENEIENAEILLAEEGAYIFKAYSNGHPYDTSEVWVSLFRELLSGAEPLFPAIIIPNAFPNQTTWHRIRRMIDPEMTGSEITYLPDFSADWRTYYDYRPEKIRCGVDIVLHPGFSASGGRSLMRQTSHLAKDFSGELFDDVIHQMISDEWLKRFRFLGKYIAQVISVFISEGRVPKEVLAAGFDYERWKKSQKGKPVPPKSEIVDQLIRYVVQAVVSKCEKIDVRELFSTKRRHFFELKDFIKRESRSSQTFGRKCDEVQAVLKQSTSIVSILELPRALQEELMHWIFLNEDRVWRYRGGRDGHETLQQYMEFLGSGNKSHCQGPALPGMVVFSLKSSDESPTVSDVVAYAVGEHVQMDDSESEAADGCRVAYEVVTAWVNPRFRGLNLAVSMYCGVMGKAHCPAFICDVLEGSLDHIIRSSFAFRTLRTLRLLPYIVKEQRDSYEVIAQDGKKERFERLVINSRPVVWAIKVKTFCSYLPSWSICIAVGSSLLTGAVLVIKYRK